MIVQVYFEPATLRIEVSYKALHNREIPLVAFTARLQHPRASEPAFTTAQYDVPTRLSSTLKKGRRKHLLLLPLLPHSRR